MKRDIIDLRPRDTPDPALLPGLLREIADVAGVEAALAIAQAKGGTRVHFPGRQLADSHWLVQAAGREAADTLCRHFRAGGAGISLDVPSGASIRRFRLRRQVRDMRAAGASVRETAAALGLTERTVYKWAGLNA